MTSVDWDNRKDFIKKMKDTLRGQRTAAHAAMEDVTDQTAQRALAMTPRLTGALQDSQQVNDFSDPKNVIFEISYNKNGNVPYAVLQHEETKFLHLQDNNPPEVQDHFLGKALDENPQLKFEKISKSITFGNFNV